MIEGSESNGWSALVEPPPDGLSSLRWRLARHERRRKTLRRASACGVLAAVAVVAALVWTAPYEKVVVLPQGDDLLAIRFGLRQSQSEPAAITPAKRNSAALLRVPTKDDRVAFYLVGEVPAAGPGS